MLATNEVVTTLLKARELIADEKNHNRWRLWNDEKTKFCVNGALMTAIGAGFLPAFHPAFQRLQKTAKLLHGLEPHEVNNTMPHAATIAMIDKAIELELAETK